MEFNAKESKTLKKQKILDFENEIDRTEYNFVNYYLTPLKILNLLCLSPNRITFHEATRKFEVKKTPIQNAVCLLIHTFLWIFSIQTFQGSLHRSTNKRSPAELFGMLTPILWTSNVYILTYHCYSQRNEILNLLSRPKIKLDKSWKKLLVPVLTAVFFLYQSIPVFFVIPWDLSVCPWHYYVEQSLLEWSRQTIQGFSIDLTNSTTLGNPPLSQQVILSLCMLFNISRDVVGYLLFTILLISCFGVYEISSCMERKVGEMSEFDNVSVKSYLGQYLIAKSYIEDMNKVSGPILLLAFVTAISFCSMRFAVIFYGGHWAYGVISGSYLCVLTLGLLLAAEGHAKFKRVKIRLRQYRIEKDVKCSNECCNWYPASYYLDSDSDPIGLNGGSFFTVSYSLLGQAVSVFLTYLVLMVQFEAQKQI